MALLVRTVVNPASFHHLLRLLGHGALLFALNLGLVRVGLGQRGQGLEGVLHTEMRGRGERQERERKVSIEVCTLNI